MEESKYPVVLFYTKTNPNVFYKTRELVKPADHMEYSYFDKYHFYSDLSNVNVDEKSVYLVQNNIGLDTTIFSKYKHKLYGDRKSVV